MREINPEQPAVATIALRSRRAEAMSYQGGTHKPSHHIERQFISGRTTRAAKYEPGTRVIVRTFTGAPNPFAGRTGEVVGGLRMEGGETLYRVLLDYPLPGETPGEPVEVFEDELTRTHLPKADVSVPLEPRPTRRLHTLEETYLIGGVSPRERS
jgi:hypothetical protein